MFMETGWFRMRMQSGSLETQKSWWSYSGHPAAWTPRRASGEFPLVGGKREVFVFYACLEPIEWGLPILEGQFAWLKVHQFRYDNILPFKPHFKQKHFHPLRMFIHTPLYLISPMLGNHCFDFYYVSHFLLLYWYVNKIFNI